MAALAGCVETAGKAGDSARDTSEADPFTPVAVPLGGCSWYHTAEIQVGGQALHVSVDSGSATLAVSGEGCASCEDAGVTDLYDTSHGTNLGEEASGYYDAGEMGWNGDIYRDDVAFDGLPAVRTDFVSVNEQASMFGTSRCDSDRRVPMDGIFGLGPDAALVDGTQSYLTRLVDEAGMPDAFAMHLCHAGGTLWMGGYDAAETTGEMQYTEVADGWLYTVLVTGFALEGADGTVAVPVTESGGGVQGLLDSGGPNLIVPAIAYDALVDTISADPDFAVLGDTLWNGAALDAAIPPETMAASLPPLRVELADGVELQLSATESYLSWWDNQDGTWAYWASLYDGTALGWDTWIDLGNRPMYDYVVLTDRAEGRVGFAPAVSCP